MSSPLRRFTARTLVLGVCAAPLVALASPASHAYATAGRMVSVTSTPKRATAVHNTASTSRKTTSTSQVHAAASKTKSTVTTKNMATTKNTATTKTAVTTKTATPTTSTAKVSTSVISSTAAVPAAATQPSAGALPVGQAAYPVPANAVHVSPRGSDSNPGTLALPVQTVGRALALVASGGTVVLHAGSYHEELGYISKTVTIENAPGEAAWLDGSQVITNFSASGSTWTTPYSYTFDSGPTFKQGQADYTQANWNFVNANHPMAAHPDQVWIDGVAQQQVASASAVGAGSFFVDTAAHRLVLGTNPAGHEVRVATLQQALRLGGAGSVLRGFGVRNYANTQYMMGMVVSYAANATIQNLEIDNAATVGLGLGAAGDKVSSTTVRNAGMNGVHGNNVDGLVLDRLLVTGSNAEKFNFAPASAGVKISRTAGFTLSNSQVLDNFSSGLWTDEDVRDITVSGSTFRGNAANAVMLELSARALVVNNRMVDNGQWGDGSLVIMDSNKTQVWNNTIVGPRAAIRLLQDSRTRATQAGVGDARPGAIDADMTWQTANTVIDDNVLQDNGLAGGALAEGRGNVSNYAVVHAQHLNGATINQMVTSSNANVVARLSGPMFAVVWQPAGSAFIAYTTWDKYRAAQPTQDTQSYYSSTAVVDANGTLLPGVSAKATSVTQPAGVVSLLGHTTTLVGAA